MFRSCALLLSTLAFAPSLAAQTRPAPTPAPRPAPPRPAQRRPAVPAPKAAPAPTTSAPKPVPQDLHLALVHATGGTSTLSTVQLKGGRARISVGDNLASVQQCDSRQTLQLNTQARTFLSVPFDDGSTAKAALAARKKGGTVIYRTTVTDTGTYCRLTGITTTGGHSLTNNESRLTLPVTASSNTYQNRFTHAADGSNWG